MYRCEVCTTLSTPRELLKVFAVQRLIETVGFDGKKRYQKEISREVKVCTNCKIELGAGIPLNRLMRRKHPKYQAPPSIVPVPVSVGRSATGQVDIK